MYRIPICLCEKIMPIVVHKVHRLRSSPVIISPIDDFCLKCRFSPGDECRIRKSSVFELEYYSR